MDMRMRPLRSMLMWCVSLEGMIHVRCRMKDKAQFPEYFSSATTQEVGFQSTATQRPLLPCCALPRHCHSPALSFDIWFLFSKVFLKYFLCFLCAVTPHVQFHFFVVSPQVLAITFAFTSFKNFHTYTHTLSPFVAGAPHVRAVGTPIHCFPLFSDV